jgi:aminoglycoside 6'-N-acetyltransferase I
MIRPCASPEQAGWLELRVALWPHHDPEAHVAEMARFCAEPARFGQFLAIADDGEVQGFVEVALRSDYVNGTHSRPVAFVEGVYVVSHARRRGVARSLVQAAEQWARARGCRELASDARIDNPVSHALHGALGFEETERVVFFRKVLATG